MGCGRTAPLFSEQTFLEGAGDLEGIGGYHGGGVEFHSPYVGGPVRRVSPVHEVDHVGKRGPVFPGGGYRGKVEGDVEGPDAQRTGVTLEGSGDRQMEGFVLEALAQEYYLLFLYGGEAGECPHPPRARDR